MRVDVFRVARYAEDFNERVKIMIITGFLVGVGAR